MVMAGRAARARRYASLDHCVAGDPIWQDYQTPAPTRYRAELDLDLPLLTVAIQVQWGSIERMVPWPADGERERHGHKLCSSRRLAGPRRGRRSAVVVAVWRGEA